ncbi:LOW QUALITY PROTEIN: protocadherin gamma-A11-like [Erpetoichthys calabaricus]|uniref:LOW QUALITY PROTEIN: protocadherin gamma-A11-like n=1 Tax=Erpetoichthys calabaricus TaxID=27687 RepID=UPI0022340CF3|nr:LOW QUALITY PROTEIN: protocadherin gamma-A11-like [Erpetoichthys calabaricus]
MINQIMAFFYYIQHVSKTTLRTLKRQVLIFIVFTLCTFVVKGEIRYSIPEEMLTGSIVGNVAKDLGLDVKRLKTGSARIFTDRGAEYFELNTNKGTLLVKDRIDREQLCARITPCTLNLRIVLENPIEFYIVIVEIVDVNDNDPIFPNKNIKLEISELSVSGARFALLSATDSDAGLNALLTYTLTPTDNFNLKIRKQSDGSSLIDLLLVKQLDREQQEEHGLLLTAIDGGSPPRSATAEIYIVVLDANDNAPVFTQEVYKTAIKENALIGSVLITVTATDADKEIHGRATYSVTHVTDDSGDLFEINANSGEIKLTGQLDYETFRMYEITVQAKDPGGHTDSCKVLVDITDVNDNIPVISIISVSNEIPENSGPGTVVAVINIQDKDSGKNGQVTCVIADDLPFKLKSSIKDLYSLETDTFLDRELTSQYNISIFAKDGGEPSLSSSLILILAISDVNDNPPKFENQHYTAFISENNSPGYSFFSLRAKDDDVGVNGKLSYFIEQCLVQNISVSSYVSVNSEEGSLYALRAFDYEHLKRFQVSVIAKDGGSPSYSASAVIDIFVQDQNDNAPQILYPIQNKASAGPEMLPRTADVGYLVTKVVAVDMDSGQNAWLSYKLLKFTDQTLFKLGVHNGELRTIREVTEKDSTRQTLVISVEDNGQPSQSTTVTINVAVTDSFPQALAEFNDLSQEASGEGDLKFYLVLALTILSFLFITFIVILITFKIYSWRQSRLFKAGSNGNLPVIPYYPPRYADVSGTGTLRNVYNYEVCLTTDSGRSDFKYIKPVLHSEVKSELSGLETMPLNQKTDVSVTEELMQVSLDL